MDIDKKAKSVHSEHRARVKLRFLKEGLDSFAPHNILELLLFYSIPYADTNPTAHALIERFGSISSVFDAPFESLIEIPGIGEHTAVLLKLIPALSRKYCEERFSPGTSLPDYDKLGAYFVSRFIGSQNERVSVLLLDNALRIIHIEEIFEGSVNSAHLSTRRLAELVILKKASSVILAHNHPAGLPIASQDDLDTTRKLRSFFNSLQVTLIDHFIVAEDKYTSINKEYFMRFTEEYLNTKQQEE